MRTRAIGRSTGAVAASALARAAISVAREGRRLTYPQLLRELPADIGTSPEDRVSPKPDGDAAAPVHLVDDAAMKVAVLIGGSRVRGPNAARLIELDGFAAVDPPKVSMLESTPAFLQRLRGGALHTAAPTARWAITVAPTALAGALPDEVAALREGNADVFCAHQQPDAQRPEVRQRPARHIVVPFSSLFSAFSDAVALDPSGNVPARSPKRVPSAAGAPAMCDTQRIALQHLDMWAARELRDRGASERRVALSLDPVPGELYGAEAVEFASLRNAVSVMPLTVEMRLLGAEWIREHATRFDANCPESMAASRREVAVRVASRLRQLLERGASASTPGTSVGVGLPHVLRESAELTELRRVAAASSIAVDVIGAPPATKSRLEAQAAAVRQVENVQERYTPPRLKLQEKRRQEVLEHRRRDENLRERQHAERAKRRPVSHDPQPYSL